MTDNLDWLAPTITALSGLASVVAAIYAAAASRKSSAAESNSLAARESAVAAKENAIAARAETAETRKAVDGKMAEVVALVRKDALSEGKAGEKEAQAGRELAVETALSAERARTQTIAGSVAEAIAETPLEVEIKAGPGVETPLIVTDKPPTAGKG